MDVLLVTNLRTILLAGSQVSDRCHVGYLFLVAPPATDHVTREVFDSEVKSFRTTFLQVASVAQRNR